ncbi:hypothetical protein JCM8202_003256 [Rhodotorula sphaerocarpa]
MSGNVTFGGQIPAGAAWIGPDYAHLLQQVRAGQSPYLFLVDVVQKLFHPAVPIGFRTQLYFLLGLFGVCALLIITGLVIRLRQGRFWVFHRLDRTVVLPNASTLFGLCALVFVALGFWLITATIEVSRGYTIPRTYTGLRQAWFGAIWTGAFFEIWTTVAGWYVRKHGAHYRESRWRSCVAGLLPVAVLVIAWVPPVVLSIPYAQKFNHSFHISQEITADLLRWQRSWHPGDGLNMANLLSLFTPGAQLGDELVTSHKFSQIAAAYCTAVFFLTFFIYILAASLEVAQLEQAIRELQAQAPQREEQARALKASPRPVSSDISAPVLAYQSNPTLSLGTGSRDAAAEKATPDPAPSQPWLLLVWVRRNRIWSAACIAVMLLAQAAVDLWRAVTPLDLQYPSGQFQVEILIASWVHGLLATAVSLLLLFRSFDATSSTFLARMKAALPWLPLPPTVEPLPPTVEPRAQPKSITSDEEQPPLYHAQAASASRGNVIPLVSCPSFSPPRVCEDDGIELKHPYAASRPRSDLTDEGALEGSGPSWPQSAARLRSDSLTTEGEQYLDAIEKARQRWLPSRNAS